MCGPADRGTEGVGEDIPADGPGQGGIDVVEIREPASQNDDVGVEDVAHHSKAPRQSVQMTAEGRRRQGISRARRGHDGLNRPSGPVVPG